MTWRAAESPAGAGYFLCGDAPAVLDPASSHGVLKALVSGTMAAHQITLVRSGRVGERGVTRARELYTVFGAPSAAPAPVSPARPRAFNARL